MADDVTIPRVSDLLWPTLSAVADLGGSAQRAEILEHVRGVAGLTDEQIAVVYSGPTGKSKALYRAEWAIYWLKTIGALESSQRGVYATTPAGNTYLRMDAAAASAGLRTAYKAAQKQAAKKAAAKRAANQKEDDGPEPGSGPDDDWRTALLEALKKMDPAAFERLAKRLLREAGFQKVDGCGESGGRWHRRRRPVQDVAGELSDLLSVQAIRWQRWRGRCARFSRGDGGPRRQGADYHHRDIHPSGPSGSDERWCPTGRPHRQ